MQAWTKPLANALAIALALLLLGTLLLVSSGTSDGVQRSLDQQLVGLRELGSAMQSEVVTADGLQLDASDRFVTLSLEFDASRKRSINLMTELLPESKGTLEGTRQVALWLFNSLDSDARSLASEDLLRGEFDRLSVEGQTLLKDVQAFSASHAAYLAHRESLADSGRQVVSDLRQRGQEAAADVVFAGVQQALERIRRTTEDDTSLVTNVARRIRDVSGPNEKMRVELVGLSQQIDAMVPLHLEVQQQLDRVARSEFVNVTESVRSLVINNYLYALKDTGDARVLLNIYTLLMLINLVFFGFGLARSHAVLNRSHTILEERVKERTHELETAYEDLKESQVQLVQAEKMSSLGQLVAGVVHEINTPLLYVLNNTQMTHEAMADLERGLGTVKKLVSCLNEEPPASENQIGELLTSLRETMDVADLEEGIEEVLALTTDSTEGLNDIDALVKSLKDFSRLDRATYDRFDVREGLEKTLLITKNLLKYGIDVEKNFEEVPEILCAPSRVNQVFINLITNAAQAMDGKGKLQLSTRVNDSGQVVVGVRDTGCGIAADHLEKVLDPFFTTKPVGEGTGLGLSIVRKIMDEHGGKLEISSKVDAGTQITLTFPIEGIKQDGKPASSSDDVEAA